MNTANQQQICYTTWNYEFRFYQGRSAVKVKLLLCLSKHPTWKCIFWLI